MSDTSGVAPSREAPVRSRRGRRILTAVLVILIALLGLSSYLLYSFIAVPRTTAGIGGEPVDTGGLEWVRSIYGTSNRVEDQFSQTQAAVSAADGTVYITDSTVASLMRFSPDGRYSGALRSLDASAPLFMPSRMAIGPDGLIYICEATQDQLRVLRPDGTDAGSISVPKPVSVAVSADRIAVGSLAGFAILEKSGKPIKVFGSRGKGDDQFDYVHGIAFGPDGNVYVADSYNNRLSAYDPSGKRLWIVRTGNPANGGQMVQGMLAPTETTETRTASAALQLPLGLTIDGAGRVVVIDMYECALAVFEAKTGRFIAKYGEAGAEDGQFFYPVSVGYDAGRDWFTVADAMNRRVQIVRIPGSAGTAGVVATVNRTLTGPLRACLFPLLLLVLAIIAWFVTRAVRRRRAARELERGAGAAAGTDTGGDESPDRAIEVSGDEG